MYLKESIIYFNLKIAFLVFLLLSPNIANAQDNVELQIGLSNLAPPCGNEAISIASMQWPSAVLLAQIHAQILEKQYGCKVKIIDGDIAITASSMATTGQPLVAPEMWIARISEIWNSAQKNNIMRKSANSYSGLALEAWFIPDYIAKNHPDLTSIATLKDYWQVFRSKQGQRARFISCPKDWACSIINRNMLKALGLARYFEIIEPSDRFELDNIIADAVSRREAILFYYWQPNSVLAQLDFLQLDMGEYDANNAKCLAQIECENPQISSFPPEPVAIVLVDKLFTQSPQVASYFRRASMPIKEMNQLLALQSEGGKTAKEIANWFIVERKAVWQKWIGNK